MLKYCAAIILAGMAALAYIAGSQPSTPAKTETLTCVRIKEVTPAGTINYLCEVRK